MKRRPQRWGMGAALLALLCACGDAPEETLSEFASPDGDYLLRVTRVAARGSDGADQIHLYLVPRGMAAGAPVVSTELANDGTPFSGRQIGLTWVAQRTVLMCLKPRGAAHHGVRVELSDPPRVDKDVQC
ncbi:MAG: hypothetical protein IT492_17005 [Gammaproteobacteria bacterium]|nr:hypothetical protein [Gammaproteobacteria bacterium]